MVARTCSQPTCIRAVEARWATCRDCTLRLLYDALRGKRL